MNSRSRTTRLVVACAFLLPTAFLSSRILGVSLHPKQVIAAATLPAKVGAWSGTAAPLTDAEAEMLETPGWSQRTYVDPTTGDQIQVLLLQVDNTQNAHDPKLCMQGSGFKLTSETTAPVDSSNDMAMKASFSKDEERLVMLSWLQTSSGTIADLSGGMKLKGLLEAVKGRRLDGIAVRVIALPNSITGASPKDDAIALSLWRTISQQIDFPGLVRQVHGEKA